MRQAHSALIASSGMPRATSYRNPSPMGAPTSAHIGSSRASREESPGAVTLECPRTFYTDLNRLCCKVNFAVWTSGVTVQRITSSAWKRRDGGMVSPRAWAVLRLMTSSNVVGCSTETWLAGSAHTS